MMQSRRGFLATSSAFAAGILIGGKSARAASSIALGEMTLETVSDGYLNLPGGFIFDPMPTDELKPILDQYSLSEDVLTPPCNVTLLRDGDQTILFDVGSGPDFAPNAGDLLMTLEQRGIAPEDITHVVFTHAHPDHLWGLLDDFDDPLFTEATYLIGKSEWDYWMDPNTVESIGEARAAFAVGAQRRLEMIEDNISFFGDGEEILPNVAAHACFGHTPGHMAFEVRSGSHAVMIVGDAIGNHHVAFERPDWPSGSDQDQDTAAASRRRLLDKLAHEQMPLIGFHLTDGGLGRVEKHADGYRYVSEI